MSQSKPEKELDSLNAMSYYEVLGIQHDDSDIKKAFKKQSVLWHPDKREFNSKYSINYYTQRFIKMQKAVEILSDPEARKKYDAELLAKGMGRERKVGLEANTKDEELMKDVSEALQKVQVLHEARKNLGKKLANAAMANDWAEVLDLCDQGASLNEISKGGYCALHYAVMSNNEAAAEYLLLCKADVNVKSSKGETPIHLAVKCNKLELCQKLINLYKAQTDLQDNRGFTPLHLAIDKNSTPAMIDLLLQNTVHYQPGFFSQFFWSESRSIDLQDTRGNTPLHLAAEKKDEKTYQKLLKHKANPKLKNQDGVFPEDILSGQIPKKSSLKPGFEI